MANISTSLFFKDSNREYSVGAITFDLILGESHSMTSEVTQYTVEEGSVISDHIQKQLRTGNATYLITNFSLFINGLFENRSQVAFNKLEELYEKEELVTLVTTLKVYENVAITDISIDRNEDSGEALIASITFQQVKIVKLQQIILEAVVNLKDMNSDLNRQAAVNLNVGKQVGVGF